MDAKRSIFREKPDEARLARALRSRNVFLLFNASHKIAKAMLDGTVEVPEDLRWPGYVVPVSENCKPVSMGTAGASRELGCDDDRSCELAAIAETLPGVVEQAKKTPAEVFHNQSENDEFLLGKGPRAKGLPRKKPGPAKGGQKKRPEERGTTHDARWNRGQDELSVWAFAVMLQLTIWRGAPAVGDLPYFTKAGLARHFHTDWKVIDRAIKELVSLGWVECKPYDCHHKNSLYRLVPLRKVPVPEWKRLGLKRPAFRVD